MVYQIQLLTYANERNKGINERAHPTDLHKSNRSITKMSKNRKSFI